MAIFATDPNQRLARHLEEGSVALRNHIQSTTYNGSSIEIDRVTRYHLFWNFYNGLHYKDYNDNMLAYNYVRAFIDKVTSFLIGPDAFSVRVGTYDSDVVPEELEKNVEKLIIRNWRKNKQKLLIHEILQMGSICGDAWVGMVWDKNMNCCKLTLYDSRQCFPVFLNGDINTLESFTIRQNLEKTATQKAVVRITKFTTNSMETWLQKTSEATIKDSEKIDWVKTPHTLGFIPVVHFKNKPSSTSYYSTSDAQDILKLNKVYNELNQEIKAIIDYHATPTTVVTGATMKNLKRGLGNIWSGLPPEANVFNLGLDVDLSASTAFIASIKTSMHELSDVPENVLGKIQAISGTSAAALKLTFLPLIQQAELKAVTYGEGIRELNEMILKHYGIYAPNDAVFKEIPKEFLDDHFVDPVFAFGLPNDRMITLQEGQMEMQMKIGSRKELMNRLGKNNVPTLMEEISTDNTELAKMQSASTTIMNEAALKGQNNPPIPQGNPQE